MIRQRIGDLLEISFESRWYYLVVLSDIVLLGGNIVFAYHTKGERLGLADLRDRRDGFNIITDLLMPKRAGHAARLHRFEDVAGFWKTKLAKGCGCLYAPAENHRWYIYSVSDLKNEIACVKTLSADQKAAMKYSCVTFDMVPEKILAGYMPADDERNCALLVRSPKMTADLYRECARECEKMDLAKAASIRKNNDAVDKMYALVVSAQAQGPAAIGALVELLNEPACAKWLAHQLVERAAIAKSVEDRCFSIIENRAAENGLDSTGLTMWLDEWRKKKGRA